MIYHKIINKSLNRRSPSSYTRWINVILQRREIGGWTTNPMDLDYKDFSYLSLLSRRLPRDKKVFSPRFPLMFNLNPWYPTLYETSILIISIVIPYLNNTHAFTFVTLQLSIPVTNNMDIKALENWFKIFNYYKQHEFIYVTLELSRLSILTTPCLCYS